MHCAEPDASGLTTLQLVEGNDGTSDLGIARKRSQLLLGRWYLGPACKACGEKLAVLDTERGGRAFEFGDTVLRTVCAHCGVRRAKADNNNCLHGAYTCMFMMSWYACTILLRTCTAC
jgi:hypothetical protein